MPEYSSICLRKEFLQQIKSEREKRGFYSTADYIRYLFRNELSRMEKK